MSAEEYIYLDYDMNGGLNPQEIEFLAGLAGGFQRRDFYVETSEKGLKVALKRLDLARLKQAVAQADLGSGSVFYNILEDIESIGSYGVKSGKRVYTGYAAERKVADRKKKAEKRSRFFYAEGHSFSPEDSTFPAEYLDRIICADSESFLKNLPDNCVDIILTSPPYNFGLEYENHPDTHDWEQYFARLYRILAECIRVCKYGGRIIINVQPLFSDYIPSHHLISNFFIQNKMLWKGEILWEKNNYNCKYTAWGSWKSPSSPYLKYTWEFLEIFCKGDLAKKGSREDVDIDADQFKQWVVARWNIAPERRMKTYGHPAMFPEQLAERVLKLFSYRHDIVLDPFNGAGTTSLVAARLGRRFLGVDISEEYCGIARRRLEEDGGGSAL